MWSILAQRQSDPGCRIKIVLLFGATLPLHRLSAANGDLCLVTQFPGAGREWVAQLNGTMVDGYCGWGCDDRAELHLMAEYPAMRSSWINMTLHTVLFEMRCNYSIALAAETPWPPPRAVRTGIISNMTAPVTCAMVGIRGYVICFADTITDHFTFLYLKKRRFIATIKSSTSLT